MKLILGHGKTGQSIARFLTSQKEPFFIYDDNAPTTTTDNYDTVVKSPGVPLSHPLCLNKKVINDLDLFTPKAKVIAITGACGKTTLTTLIYEFLKYNNIETAVGGNIDTPVLDLPTLSESGVYVLELSSFQLETAPHLNKDIAIWLNLFPNHLDRHGTMEDYRKAKFNIFNNAKTAIICDEHTKPPCPFVNATQDPASILKQVALLLGLPPQSIPPVLAQFKGLEHRLEVVLENDNIMYVNDSKSTTFSSVAFAISKYKDKGELHLIMGGVLKENDASCLDLVLKNVSRVYVFGKEREKIQSLLSPFISCETFETLKDVMDNLNINPLRKTVILLSPGGASYDLYKIYTERGDDFKRLVAEGGVA